MSLTRHVNSLNLDLALRNRENDHLVGNLEAAIFRKRLHAAENLYQRDLAGHYGCVNALEFSHGGQYLASGGDDKRVLLWNVDQETTALGKMGNPRSMYGEHTSNIFCLGFDILNSYVFSGGNDEMVIQHDLATGKNLNYFAHGGPVYGLSVDRTSPHLFSVATENGEVLVYDLRTSKSDPLTVAKFSSPFNAVEFHPLNGNNLATANTKRGAMLWDLRQPTQALYQYKYIPESPSCMSVRFNCNGTLLLTLHRRLPPILFKPNCPEPLAAFYHEEYFNSCTMKSCTFAGPQDELVISGSDNFNMFIWRMDEVKLDERNQLITTPPVILTGHRSIVNQVRYNRQRCLIASSGVEKIIKLWSPFAQRGWQGDLLQPSRETFCTRTLHRDAADQVSQDFTSRNTDEDQVMLAFFDTLVQRELETWNTTGNNTSSDTSSDTSTERSRATSVSEVTSDGDADGDNDAEGDGEGEGDGEDEGDGDGDDDIDTPNVSELSLQTHPNRIFYLIAKKGRALLQMAVKAAGGKQQEELLARLLDEQRQVATEARISDWLDETHQLFGDDQLPTTSADAAAREQRRRVSDLPQTRPLRKIRMVGPLPASFVQLERKRKLMRLRVAAAMKRRRRSLRPLRESSDQGNNESAVSSDSDWQEDDDNDDDDDDDDGDDDVSNASNASGTATANGSANANSNDNNINPNGNINNEDTNTTSSTTSMTSMEAQLSQAPSTSDSFPMFEANNNNSQMTSHNNNNNNHKIIINGLPAGAEIHHHAESSTSSTTSTASSSQATN
ncbi:uncharacterized protein Dwil_GK10939 [Drosophila willistoni]|uniref:DDB1- and CUL4-associated factor 5 n=1 Tax=Drosophila willistoni TaxID=7260 RepID=B4N953_DROWI|nr:DDB1- and CUL4-associated factor 5 [Drosophila willistoni]EDW81600.2 uncharacterized protein Dwil_GK10939 [Drosophila willistoni]